MESPGQLLNETRQSRINLLLSKLDNNFDKFNDVIINGILCKIPLKNQIPNKRYYQFKVRLPIGYETTTKYRIRMKGVVYDLYKYNNNYYLIDLPTNYVVSQQLFVEFSTKIQFSFCFYLLYTLLQELTANGLTVELSDYLFTGLLDQFNTPNGDLKLTLSPFSVKNKIMDPDRLYISLFN